MSFCYVVDIKQWEKNYFACHHMEDGLSASLHYLE